MTATWRAVALLCAAPTLVAIAVLLAPIVTDPVALFGGLAYDLRPNWLPGYSTIDPNKGFTSDALGIRAALDLVAWRVPLWNPFEGLGSPLLGEMQAAALFPPTLLLLLPHGQLVEQTFLQIVAGLGSFLFLRRFGLGTTAALAGGLLFEFNGVFAWLRNAIYNPVALLPWLFYAVESLFAAARAGHAWRRRAGTITLGALAAALALYAGFPEVVFYYCLPLFGWAALRGFALPWRRALAYLGDLSLVAVVALVLSAPLLLAFLQFLADSHVGAHQDDGFKDAVIPATGIVMYLLPYLFGPISFSPSAIIAPLWNNGGYLGLTTCALAIGGVLSSWRRPVVWLLLSWIVFAVGVSHDAPGFLAAFRHVPLVTVSAFARYLNAGWLFCGVTLAAIFVDRMPARPRLVGIAAAAVAVLLVAAALTLAWPALTVVWQPHGGHRTYVVVSLLAAALLLAGMIAAVWRRGPTALIAVATTEAILSFAVPFASSPRRATVDRQLVRFLQHNSGLQRVAVTGNVLSPNYGSAFGIATLNYDDLPVPRRTVDFVQRELQPDAIPIMFRPVPMAGPQTLPQRRDAFLAHERAYAGAGVQYVLGEADLFSYGPSFGEAPMRPVTLAPGQSVTVAFHPAADLTAVAAVTVRVGTFGGKSNGRLAVQICQGERCQEGSGELGSAIDNAPFRLSIAPAFALTDAPFQLTLSIQGGEQPVALWAKPPAEPASDRAFGLPGMQGLLPMIAVATGIGPRLVLQTQTTGVFELADPRPYATAPGCRIEAQTQERMTADCERPTRLTRLEVFMAGWTATVNGVSAPVFPVEDTFQAVELPAGQSTVTFVYAPTGVRPAVWIAAATLLGLMVLASMNAWRIRR